MAWLLQFRCSQAAVSARSLLQTLLQVTQGAQVLRGPGLQMRAQALLLAQDQGL